MGVPFSLSPFRCDIDSDGNCTGPENQLWTELTLSLRGSATERLDIDPLSLNPLVLVIRSSQAVLCQRAAGFIVSISGGLLEPLSLEGSYLDAAHPE